MHIKQLTIQGFKSYRDQTLIGPFHAGHNAVVGRNGSGKSNFFAAIRFVLGDAYGRLGAEERQALLHEGSGQPLISAYVEIVFANDDNRFPTGRDELVLRRTVGLKKDEWSVDKKAVTKQDVANLLQAAGFSRSNPYYIVPQGRITALTSAKDGERLQLLKEVAGTRVYEEHRAESTRIMEETNVKRQKIAELLEYIDARLGELAGEKDELKDYLDVDRKRRTCEYLLYHREQLDVADALEQAEEEYKADGSAEMQDDASYAELAGLQAELHTARQRLASLQSEQCSVEEDMQEQIRAKAALELLVREGEGEETSRGDEKAIVRLDRQIAGKEAKLADLQKQLAGLAIEEEQLCAHMETMEARKNALYGRANRVAQFKTAAERDRWIRKELDTLGRTVALGERQQMNLQAEIDTEQRRADDLKALIAKIEADEEHFARDHRARQQAHRELVSRREAAIEARKELWREEGRLEGVVAEAKAEAEHCQRELLGCMDRATAQGLQSITVIAERLGLGSRVHGPLYSLFDVDDVYRTAVEVIGGASLFHIVVDDDDTAGRLLEVMIRERAGRVTFMPLNRLRPPATEYPTIIEDGEPQALPMLHQLRFDSRFLTAMQQVFGKAMIVPDLTIGSTVARSHGLNAVTLEGDQADRKGALTGGYIDHRRSRLAAIRGHRRWCDTLAEQDAILRQVRDRLLQAEQIVTRATADLQGHASSRSTHATGDLLDVHRRELHSAGEILLAKRRSLAMVASSIRQARHEAALLGEEVASPFRAEEHGAELLQLNGDVETCKGSLEACRRSTGQLSSELAELQGELEQRLRRQRRELLGKGSDAKALLPLNREALKVCQQAIAECTKRRREIATSIDSLNTQLAALASTIEQAELRVDAADRQAEIRQQVATRHATRRQALLTRKDDCARRIRDLAVMPDESTMGRFREASSDAILRHMHTLTERLRSFGPVNKKAIEQHAIFTKQGEQLLQRQAELSASATAITDFIRVLDQHKDESIDRTFTQVAANFAHVFQRLVPTGHGRLLILRGDDSSTSLEYTGVAIKVSFNSKELDEGLLMSQLSGGQKSLVALALIFAIQRCDPAPFYLFDEVDANLDAAHRTAVAAMIDEMAHGVSSRDAEMSEHDKENASTVKKGSGSAQFITTTFRPELLQHADHFYGTTFEGRVSRVRRIGLEEATRFVDGHDEQPVNR